MFLTNADRVHLMDLRHDLHRHPEVSGEERETAARITRFVEPLRPQSVVTGLGGHGVAIVFEGKTAGPTLVFRSELDALPIEEKSEAAHRSTIVGKGHLCGHDGHSTILTALALGLSRDPPQSGRAILLFQPAEENGAGAAAVIADPRFAALKPDFFFSLHNIPGMKMGHVALKAGPVNCASRGMKICFSGKTAHASMPETGLSPMGAMATLMPELTALSRAMPPAPDFRMVTITHASLGEAAFGIAPGDAEIWATLRTLTDDHMDDLVASAELMVRDCALRQGLGVSITYEDVFHHCENAPQAVEMLRMALDGEHISHDERHLPIRASEDFGRYRALAPSAMFFLGAGEATPALHNPDYDFPDELIETGARIFMRVVRNCLG